MFCLFCLLLIVYFLLFLPKHSAAKVGQSGLLRSIRPVPKLGDFGKKRFGRINLPKWGYCAVNRSTRLAQALSLW